MDFLTALKVFKKWAVKALPKAVSKNKELREEIRGIVGDLADDLMRRSMTTQALDPRTTASYVQNPGHSEYRNPTKRRAAQIGGRQQ